MKPAHHQYSSGEKNIFPRIFVVGCPRSGTTLLQSLISAHPLILSFPESHFFPNILSGSRLNRVFGIASKRAKKNIMAFLKMLEREDLLDFIPVKSKWVKSYTHSFVNILDRITQENGKKLWLEKTPQHLLYIRPIEKYIHNAKFIHVLRNGEDVVASLYEVTHEYPKNWGGFRTIDQCTKRWIDDVSITIKYTLKQNHLTIKYEELVDNPEKILRQVCSFIGVEFHRKMITKYSKVADSLLLKEESWKKEVIKSIKNNNGKKFFIVFDNEERKYIRNLLKNSKSFAFYNNIPKDAILPG